MQVNSNSRVMFYYLLVQVIQSRILKLFTTVPVLNIRFKETLNRERTLKKRDTNLHAQNFTIEFHRFVSVRNFKDKMQSPPKRHLDEFDCKCCVTFLDIRLCEKQRETGSQSDRYFFPFKIGTLTVLNEENDEIGANIRFRLTMLHLWVRENSLATMAINLNSEKWLTCNFSL